MEKILKIVEGALDYGQYNSTMEGYFIITEKRVIKVLISNNQSCCEDWGYCASDDLPNEFIGAELLSVDITDDKLETFKFETGYEGAAQFVTFVTDRGPFQVAVYNWHNGYYGHAISIKEDDTILYEGYL